MYNSKPTSVSHKDGGDNSLIPAWSFLSLPCLLRLDLARNLMTSSLHSAIWKAAPAIGGPQGLSWRPLTVDPCQGCVSDLICSSSGVATSSTRGRQSPWASLIFFPYFSSGLQLALAVWKTNFTPLICYETHFLKQLRVLILSLQRK